MPDLTDALLDDAGAEQRTRATYAAWMRRGLEVARDVASGGVRYAWPAADEQSPGTPLPPNAYSAPPGATPGTARERGWLVSGPAESEPAEPEPDGPLSGLAVGVKDIIDVAGLPTHNGTGGALWREPTVSASVWTTLAEAGARCVGKTATHEMAWGVTTPQIDNPHSPERIAGGSSGGSAACVAAGTAHGALGTDTGGSIRIPAALCGVVGFRPTTGSIDVDGITALAPEQDVTGPLAADVSTCAAMLECLLRSPLGSSAGVSGVRIGVLANPGRLDPLVQQAYEDSLVSLHAAGATVVRCDTSVHRDAASISLLTMLRSSARLHAAAVRADPGRFGGGARALLTLGEQLAGDTALVHAAAEQITARTAQLFGESGIDTFVTPTVPCVAPMRGEETTDVGGRPVPVAAALTRFTAWASVAAMPAISVPLPTPDLPVGLQVMAPPAHERLCIRIARQVERLGVLDSGGSNERP